jgi:hypothetical protein
MTTVTAATSWKLLAERADTESDPRRRALLQTVLRHLESEVAGDLDTTMDTLTDDPDYRVWGATDHTGPRGRDAVRRMYEGQQVIGKNRLEYHIDRVLVDDDVVTDGVFRHAYRGAQLVIDGVADAADVNPDERYLIEYRALVVWVMSPDGLIDSEDTYKAEPARVVRRLQADELPHLGLPAQERA